MFTKHHIAILLVFIIWYIILALVNFETDNFTADVNATAVTIRVIATGPLDIDFSVEVVPDGTDLPEGGMYIHSYVNTDCNYCSTLLNSESIF